MELRAFAPFRQAARAVEALDRYTSPRRNTGGNFHNPNLFQAISEGATEGFYLMDLPGAFIQGGAGAAGSLARRYLADNSWVAAAAGAAAGAAAAVATTMVTGASPSALATCGALLGAYSGLRSDPSANVRDAGINGLILTSPFVAGPAKVVGGMGALLGAQVEQEKYRPLVGALAGTAFGVALSLAGVMPLDPIKAGIICGLGGAGGSVIGPRVSQFFRNLAEDIGEKGRQLSGIKESDGPGEETAGKKWARTLGVVPLSFGKELVLASLYGDGAWMKGLAGGALDSIIQGNIMYHSKEEKHLAT